jgi:hypothetical protein
LFWLPRVDDAEAGWYEDEDGVPHEVDDDDDDDDHEEDDREVYGGYVASHVDDVRGRSSDKTFEWLSYELQSRFKMGLLRQVLPTTERGGSKTSDEVDFLGERWTEFPDCVVIDQEKYIGAKLPEVPLSKERWKQAEAECTPEELSSYRTSLGCAAWVTGRTRGDVQYETSYLAGQVNRLRVLHLRRVNKLVRHIKDARSSFKIKLPKLKLKRDHKFGRRRLKVVLIVDAGDGEQSPGEAWTRAQAGRIVGLMDAALEPGEAGDFVVCETKSEHCKRVTHSSFDAECVSSISALDAGLAVAMLIEEGESGVRPSRRETMDATLEGEHEERLKVQVEMHTDAKSLVDKVESPRLDAALNKRRKQDVSDMKECRAFGDLRRLVHIQGKWNPADPLTKNKNRTKQTSVELVRLLSTGWYDPPTG